MTNERFPPRNRLPDELPILRIEVEHADGLEAFDPNGMIICLLGRKAEMLAWNPLPDRVSDVSGEPAVLYRSHDCEVALAPEELVRYVGHALKPEEYFALRERHGDHFEIHDDFYDAETGEALQSVFDR
jgi:hypothetical protein